MSLNAATIELLLAKGLSGEDILELARVLEASEPQRSPGAERQARYRARGGGNIPETMRQEVFERDGWVCLDCGSDQYLCADHIIPVSKGGETSFDNLQTLCLPCNSRKKDRIRKRDVRRKEANLSGGMSGGNSSDTPPNDIYSNPPPSVTKVTSVDGVKRASRDEYPKPEWADPKVWDDFKKNRKRKGKPNTASAYKRFCDDIARLSDDEWPPGRLLEHAAAEGWAGIYDPREKLNGSQNGHVRQSNNQPKYKPSAALALYQSSFEGDEPDSGHDWPALPASIGH